MHVLIVSTVYPFPENCGKARMLGGLYRFLATHPRVSRLSYFHIARAPVPDADELGENYCHAPGPGIGEICCNFASTLLGGRRPALQEALTFSRGTRRRLWAFIREQRPDVVVADTTRAAQYLARADRPPARYFAYLDDLMSRRYGRMLAMMRDSTQAIGNVLGNFAAFVPARLRGLAENPASVRLLLEHERRAMERREAEIVRYFDRCFLINPDEVEILRRRCGTDTVHPLKLLTEDDGAERACDGRAPYFVFLGDLKLPHNCLAIEQLIHEGSASLRRFLPDYRVVIAGRSAPPSLAEACARAQNFELMGFVPDLASLLMHARGLLAPLAFGSGVKIKCLEALRLGVPIIGSEIGVEGLGLEPEIEYLPAADVPAVVRQMRRLIDDREHARLVRAGRRWFAANYAPAVVRHEYEHLLLESDGNDAVPAITTTAA